MKKWITLFGLVGIMMMGIIWVAVAQATTVAILLNDDNPMLEGTFPTYVKVDLSSAKIIAQGKLDEVRYVSGAWSDTKGQRLFVRYGRHESQIAVYDIKTMSFVKNLGIISGSAPDLDLMFFPDGKRFLVYWWNDGRNQGQMDLYDVSTLVRVKNLDVFFWTEDVLFSQDGKRLYSIQDDDNAKVTVYDTTTWKVSEAIDLNTIWNTQTFSREVPDYRYNKLLIGENVRKSKAEPIQMTFFAYDLITRTTSVRIPTSLDCSGRLSYDATLLFANEESKVGDGIGSVGRLHVYEMVTGKKRGVVSVPTGKLEATLAQSSWGGSLLYFITDFDSPVPVVIINPATLGKQATLTLPIGTRYVAFGQE